RTVTFTSTRAGQPRVTAPCAQRDNITSTTRESVTTCRMVGRPLPPPRQRRQRQGKAAQHSTNV
ncbi:hypothetical protein E4U54_006490, partial [Claviceps lovelessii]